VVLGQLPDGALVQPGRARPIDVAGRELDLPANFRDGTAIHGQVARRAWQQVDDGRFRIRAGGDGWPWPYEVEQRFAVAGDVLALDCA
jgi:galactose mutarotase-like enzyme